jgi:8-oxo-dGTP diphosphatase
MNDDRPKVGIGVMIFKDGKVLLGTRKGSHGKGEHAFPGGHMEYMESFEETAKREVLEEAGIEIENVRFLCLQNLKTYAPKHYVDIGLIADWKSGEPQTTEPDKIGDWDWYAVDNFPQPLFSTIPVYLEALKNGRNFWDA